MFQNIGGTGLSCFVGKNKKQTEWVQSNVNKIKKKYVSIWLFATKTIILKEYSIAK